MEKQANSDGKIIDLNNAVDYANGAIVSKTIVDKKTGTLTLFAFDKGQGLSEHTAPFDAVVEILEGEAYLVIGGNQIIAGTGKLVVMPAGVPHEIRPGERFKMLLIMIRS